MQKAGLMRMQIRRGKRPFRWSRNKKKQQPPSFEAGVPYPKKLVETDRYRLFSLSRHPKMSKFCRFEKGQAYVDQKVSCFCTGGYREVAKEVEDPVDLEKLVVSPAPARG